MKKILQKMLAAAGMICGLAFGQTAQASHLQGSELTYGWVAPNTYQVNFKVYRDCMGASLDPNYTLSIHCVSGGAVLRTVVMSPVGNSVIGSQYCPSSAAANVCNGTYDNYQVNNFSALVTFSAAERACSGGMVRLSLAYSSRSLTHNLVGSENLYSEAIINLGSGLNNNSPQFLDATFPYIAVNKPILFSTGATDPDGDSLSYSLNPPRSGLNTPAPYQTGFSVSNPIPSNPALAFNSKTGSMQLTPTVFMATPGQGRNKYALSLEITEWRKPSPSSNKNSLKVGTVTRDLIITVVDGGSNNNPDIINITHGGQVFNANDVINLQAGQPLNLQFASADLDANSVLELSSDIASVLPDAIVNITTGPTPMGTITFTPAVSHIRKEPYYFNLKVKDNACPVRGHQTKTIGLRVSQNGGVNGAKKEIESLNSFVAYPNPAGQEVAFKVNLKKETNLQSIVIFNSLGQEVERLSVKALTIGEHNITWPNAHKHAAGNYTAQLISADKTSQTIQFSKLQ